MGVRFILLLIVHIYTQCIYLLILYNTNAHIYLNSWHFWKAIELASFKFIILKFNLITWNSIPFSWSSFSFSWNSISLSWNSISLSWNWISFSWNWISFSWNWISISWNWISFSWNYISFSWNRTSKGI